MKRIGTITGYCLCGLGYLYCGVMLWMNALQWWGWHAIWAFILSPILALFIPIISWIVEGTFPLLLFAGWIAIIIGIIIISLAGNEEIQ